MASLYSNQIIFLLSQVKFCWRSLGLQLFFNKKNLLHV